MTKFGASGNEDNFYLEHDSSVDAPEYLAGLGLDLYEYSFTHGVNIGDETAIAIGKKAKEYGIQISAHAPYYINLGNPNEESFERGYSYIASSIRKLNLMGGSRVVVHVASLGKEPRNIVFARVKERLGLIAEKLNKNFDNFMLCIEVMGRPSQIGDLDEVIELASLDKNFNICVDFGHINCLMSGGFNNKDAMNEVLLKIKNGLPPEKYKNFHAHFSKIAFNAKGEVEHLNFSEAGEKYDIDFAVLAKLLKKHSLTPHVICESKGNQAADAKTLKEIFENC